MRFGVVAVLMVVTSSAHADLRWSAGASYLVRSYDFDDVTTYPGLHLALDGWGKHGWGMRAAFHSSFSTHESTTRSTPCCHDRFEWLLELQALHMWHADQVHFGVGAGLDIDVYRAFNVSEGGDSFGDSDLAFGLHASLGVDVARNDRGTFQIVGEVGMFSLAQFAQLCGGSLSCAPQMYVFSIGVGYSPR